MRRHHVALAAPLFALALACSTQSNPPGGTTPAADGQQADTAADTVTRADRGPSRQPVTV